MNDPSNFGPPGAESYEMTPQPTYAAFRTASPSPSISPAETPGGYVAFNPQHSDDAPTPMQLQPGPRRNLTVASHQPGEGGSYFPAVASPALDTPQRSATAPTMLSVDDGSARDHRLTTGYNDILDDYGHDGVGSAPTTSPSPVLESPPSHFATMQEDYRPQSSQSAVRRPELPVDVTPRAHTTGPALPNQQQWQAFPGGQYGYGS